MTPQQRYQSDVEQNLIVEDDAQRLIVLRLQRLFDELTSSNRKRKTPGAFLMGWLQNSQSRTEMTKGIYLWGGVGRGKTYLMDLFFDCLPRAHKHRTHFHRFMQRVHSDLTRLQGEKNPLEKVAQQIADEASVLCFDEFFVSDIADAMILSGLLEALFRRNVVLVATSNVHPGALYENGLQRERFLPAIAQITQFTEILEIESETDYRLRSLSQATLYYCPIDDQTEARLLASFYELAPDRTEVRRDQSVEILGRRLRSRYCGDDVVWFGFTELCDGPRSAFDYVEIAKLFHALLLSDVPRLDDLGNAPVRRFVALVDELYDRRVKLIISAAVPIESLYLGDYLGFEFERTRSRLLEMQSHEYLASEHRA